MTQARVASLRELERLREHREQRALRELQAAGEAERQAGLELAARETEQHELEADIVATLQRPYGDAGRTQVPMIEVQRSRRRVEWLAEKLLDAKGRVREAQVALQEKTALRRAALRQHLLAHAKHEAVQEQRVRAHRADLATGERRQLEESQERGNMQPVRVV